MGHVQWTHLLGIHAIYTLRCPSLDDLLWHNQHHPVLLRGHIPGSAHECVAACHETHGCWHCYTDRPLAWRWVQFVGDWAISDLYASGKPNTYQTQVDALTTAFYL